MAENKTELLKGTLDLLILSTLSLEPKHGLGIARRIEQVTRGTFEVKAGSLFPALHRLEQEGWIAESPSPPGTHARAKYYRLTPTGQQQLKTKTERWDRASEAVRRVLLPSS